MLDPKLMAAIVAAVNAYIEEEPAQTRRRGAGPWSRAGRLQAARGHLPWARRPRPWA